MPSRINKSILKAAFLGAVLGIGATSIADADMDNAQTTGSSPSAASPMTDLMRFHAPVRLPPEDPALKQLKEVIETIQQQYVKPGVKEVDLMRTALKSIFSSLDPHSSYMDPDEYAEMQEQTAGEFGGIGVEVGWDDEIGALKVVTPMDNTPSSKAGLLPGDLIVEVDGVKAKDLGMQKTINHLRGAPNTSVTIKILRKGDAEPKPVTLLRDVIHDASLKTTGRVIGGDIGYIRVPSFNDLSTSGLQEEIAKQKAVMGPNVKGYILDLRSDPGGLLREAITVSSSFLNGGKVVSVRGRDADDNQVYTARPNGDLTGGKPLVVLINGGSASASEITAGALLDNNRATIMGTRSFGKGSVQTIMPLDEPIGGVLRMTTQLYYTPSGHSIQGQGIDPDVIVEAPDMPKIAETEATEKGAFANPDEPGAFKPHVASAKCTPSQADGSTMPADLLMPVMKDKVKTMVPDYVLACAAERLRGQATYTVTVPYTAAATPAPAPAP